MGTRLYPITERTDLIETIVGVPQGTSKILEGLKTLKKDLSVDAWYNMMDKFPSAMRLYDFELFGFGKLNSEQWEIAKSVCGPEEMYSGSIKDKDLVRAMLNEVQDYWKETLGLINIEDLDGVCWG